MIMGVRVTDPFRVREKNKESLKEVTVTLRVKAQLLSVTETVKMREKVTEMATMTMAVSDNSLEKFRAPSFIICLSVSRVVSLVSLLDVQRPWYVDSTLLNKKETK